VDPLDRELASLLCVEPSPEFRARVRVRIAGEPAPHAWLARWRTVAAGVAVLSVVAALVLGRGQLTGGTRQDVARPISSSVTSDSVASGSVASGFSRTTGSPFSRTSDPPPHAVVAAPITSGQEAVRRRRLRTATEVLVAASEVRGLRQLNALVREGRTRFVFDEETVPQEPVTAIVVTPIVIEPIAVASVSEQAGDSEGDGQ